MAYTRHPTAKHAVLPWAACAVAAISALAAPTVSAQTHGQRIAVDPQTGQMRAPELDEMAPSAARAATAPATARASAAAQGARRLTGVQFGAKGFRVDPSRMSHTVVRRGADGSIATQCVSGESAAAHAMHHVASGGGHEQ
jgi:hypothetical protein